MKQNDRSNFRLIGIKPHHNCDIRFTKVLERGKLYQFYNEFNFIHSDAGADSVITKYSKIENLIPADLYNIDDLNINISAIVGKNGSGKSTLIELLLYSIYRLGTTLKDENGNPILKPYHEQILTDIKSNDSKIENYKLKYQKLKEYFSTQINKISNTENEDVDIEFSKKLDTILNSQYRLKDLLKNQDLLIKNIALSRSEHDFIAENLKCSIYFEIDNTVWELNTTSNSYIDIPKLNSDQINPKIRNIKLLNLTQPDSYKILDSFFYTMMLNYSHHALNSEYLGFWITTLFHKNDGYKTPAVINPMRIDGNFNINTENDLAKSRLLTNLLIEALHSLKSRTKIKLTDKQYIHKVRFSINEFSVPKGNVKLGDYGSANQKENFIISGGVNYVALIQELLPLYFDGSFDDVIVQNMYLPYAEEVLNYLTVKVPKALKNYPQYDTEEKQDDLFSHFRIVLPRLKGDSSHVTFKIDRAMFYLRKLLDEDSTKLWGSKKKYIDFDLYELLDWMEIKEVKDLSLIFERIPPSIFEIDFILDSEKDSFAYTDVILENLPTLRSLSSGEQQKIHIINGVIYHLNNIFSVHNSDITVNRVQYDYINIIFDEIELYFHPDLQREFIYDLLENIKRLSYITQDPKSRIKALNFIFSTHSPFILSDIPVQNILKIEYDSEKDTSIQIIDNKQTFGANIHDLLANSFFFTDKAFTGKKADIYLKELITEITTFKNNNLSISKYESETLLKKAKLIGEPFFREKLVEMIIEQSKLTDGEKLIMLIERKKRELEDLEKLKDDNKNDSN